MVGGFGVVRPHSLGAYHEGCRKVANGEGVVGACRRSICRAGSISNRARHSTRDHRAHSYFFWSRCWRRPCVFRCKEHIQKITISRRGFFLKNRTFLRDLRDVTMKSVIIPMTDAGKPKPRMVPQQWCCFPRLHSVIQITCKNSTVSFFAGYVA